MAGREAETSTLRQALQSTRDRLETNGFEDAAIEAELLLCQAIRPDGQPLPSRAELFRRLDEPLHAETGARLASLTARRLAHEPSAYITGQREFWGLEFAVTPDVLIPRPETELLVEKALDAARGGRRTGLVAVDVGTGCGAIAVSLAKELPSAVVLATDVSWAALGVARTNARRHGVESRVGLRHGDLLLPVDRRLDLVVANLPYVPARDWPALAPELRDHEPRLALDGGESGLALIETLLRQAPRYLKPGGVLCLEFGDGQLEALTSHAMRLLPEPELSFVEDFAGIPRVLVARV